MTSLENNQNANVAKTFCIHLETFHFVTSKPK